MREEHLGQLPEVEELVSATAQGDVEVGAIFLQGSLLELLCVLYYKKKVLLGFLFFSKQKYFKKEVRTFLSCFANDFNVLHGNFKKLFSDERRHIHLRQRQKNVTTI